MGEDAKNSGSRRHRWRPPLPLHSARGSHVHLPQFVVKEMLANGFVEDLMPSKEHIDFSSLSNEDLLSENFVLFKT